MASPGTEPNSTLASVKKEHSDNSKIKKLDTGSGNAPTTLSRRRSSINFSGRRPSSYTVSTRSSSHEICGRAFTC